MMNPWLIAGGLLAAIAIFFGGAQVGAKLERTAWQAKEIKTAALVAAAKDAAAKDEKNKREKLVADNETLREDFARLSKAQNEKHQTELAAVEARRVADAGKRVPVRTGFCRPGPKPTTSEGQASSAGDDGEAAAASEFLPDTFASDLRQIAADADEVVADLRHLVNSARTAGCFLGYDAPPIHPGDTP